MKSWEVNAAKFLETGDPGTCPKCGYTPVHCVEHVFAGSPRKSITLSCPKCGSYDHFDGIPSTAND